MTRRDQVCRVWIKRHPGGVFHSIVSLDGTRHERSTGTRIRRAAREFARLHLASILNHTPPPTPPTTTHPTLL